MAKKEINLSGLDAIMGSYAPENEENQNQETRQEKEAGEGSHRGRPVGSGKGGPERQPFSTKMRKDHYEKLSIAAYWSRRSKQEVLDEALEEYFEKCPDLKGHE